MEGAEEDRKRAKIPISIGVLKEKGSFVTLADQVGSSRWCGNPNNDWRLGGIQIFEQDPGNDSLAYVCT